MKLRFIDFQKLLAHQLPNDHQFGCQRANDQPFEMMAFLFAVHFQNYRDIRGENQRKINCA